MTAPRYLLFAGVDYYPGGGWSDFGGTFATAEEAKAEGEALLVSKTSSRMDWFQVVEFDVETGEGEEVASG